MKRSFPIKATVGYHALSAWSPWIWTVIFAMAFAWVESAVVVYLRDIFFNGDFHFPLTVKWEGGRHVPNPLVRIEFLREIATIVMLAAVGWLAGWNRGTRFAFFIIAFGIWDIFYYVWLYVMIGWPKSLMTWDLLFYVPFPWVGPVITPVLIAAAMVGLGTWVTVLDNRNVLWQWRWYDLAVGLTGCLALIIAFCWDWRNILQVPGDVSRNGVPNPFAWWLYLPAYGATVGYFILRLRRMAAVRAA